MLTAMKSLLRDSNDIITNRACGFFGERKKRRKLIKLHILVQSISKTVLSCSCFGVMVSTASDNFIFVVTRWRSFQEIVSYWRSVCSKTTTSGVDSHSCAQKHWFRWKRSTWMFRFLGVIRIFRTKCAFLRQVCVFRRIFQKPSAKAGWVQPRSQYFSQTGATVALNFYHTREKVDLWSQQDQIKSIFYTQCFSTVVIFPSRCPNNEPQIIW